MTAKKCFPTSCFEQEGAKLIEKRNLMQGELGQTSVAGYCATCCHAYYSAIVLVDPSSSSWDFLSSLSSMLSPPRLFQIHTHHTGNYNTTGIRLASSRLQWRWGLLYCPGCILNGCNAHSHPMTLVSPQPFIAVVRWCALATPERGNCIYGVLWILAAIFGIA